MAFDAGTLLDQMYNVGGTYPLNTFDQTMDISGAEEFGGEAVAQETVNTVNGTNEITPTTAVSAANIGKLITVDLGVEAGTYLIIGINGSNYQVVDSSNAEPSFTATASTGTIYDFPCLLSDLNYLRSLFKEQVGRPNWYQGAPEFTNPDDTTATIKSTLEYLKDKHAKATLFRKRTFADNSGSGYTISTNDTDAVVTDTSPYTDDERNTGLPTQDGANTPDATNYNLLFVRIYKHGTTEPLAKEDGTVIWGRLIDGANASGGTGEGTDVGVKFYTGDNDATASAYTAEAYVNGQAVDFVYYSIDSLSDFTRNQMPVNEGGAFVLNGADAELYDRVNDLQEYTGGGDNETSPTITNSTNYYPFSTGAVNGLTNPADTDLEEMANALNDMIGNLDFTAAQEVIIGGDGSTLTITDMIANLADAIDDVEGMLVVNYRHTGGDINPGSAITLPGSNTYTPNSGTVEAGRYMQVYFNGQLLQANRTDYDNDYEEASTSTITMNYKKVKAGDRLTFAILA